MSHSSSHITFTRSRPNFGAASIHAGAGGKDARISSVASSYLRSGAPMTSSSGFNLRDALGGGMGSGFGGGAGSRASAASAGGAGAGDKIMGNERGAMQNLNNRLANYLETVRHLEQANKELEMKIMEALEKGGPDLRDYSKYEPIIQDLRQQVSVTTIVRRRGKLSEMLKTGKLWLIQRERNARKGLNCKNQ